MKRMVVMLTLITLTGIAAAQTTLVKGKVTTGGRPLEYAVVAIPAENTGTMTTKSGYYELTTHATDSIELTVSLIGYNTRRLMIAVHNPVTVLNINMERTPSALNEFVVSGVSKATLIKENPLPVEAVSLKQINDAAENNVIDAIAKNALGFQTVKTGPNVSKPFINGLGYNRVLTLYDGMRVETQQWGDEHGVPLDDYLIERAEVIKGPASLMYGSDAIAGVLSLFPAIPRDSDRQLHGRYLSEYQTNNGLIGNSLRLSYGSMHWSWEASGSERIAKNYTDPADGRVYNTGFKMANTAAFAGYRNASGYSHLSFTFYDNRQGIPDGSRDSLTRKFTYQDYETSGENILTPQVDNIKDRPIVPENVLNSYELSPLSQRIQDYRLYTDNNYKIGQGEIHAFAGFEQNIRREYDHPDAPSQAGEHIVLNTLDYGLRYNAPSILQIEPSIGINGMYQLNRNDNATDFPIPNYKLFDIGSYFYGRWKRGRWTVAGGIRYDHRQEDGDELYIKPNPATGYYQQAPANDTIGATKQFPQFSLQFQGVTGSIGATYKVSGHTYLKANIARGYRAPNITEIASNGLDPGAHIVYQGNLDFTPEFSLQEDAGISGTYPDASYSLTVFNNSIQDYIYEDQEVDKNGNPVVIVPGNKTFEFQQTDAQLYGGAATLDIHPQAWEKISYNNTFSCVYGFNRNARYRNAGVNGEYLPFIPPPEWLSSLNYTIISNKGRLSQVSLRAESDYSAAQNRYLGLYNTETATAAYLLFNGGIFADIRYNKKQLLQFQLQVNNIGNVAYQSHLSRLQYFEYYTHSTSGHYGIYNMGRNICLKLIVPF